MIKIPKATRTPRLIIPTLNVKDSSSTLGSFVFVGDIVVALSELLVALGRGVVGSFVVEESDMMTSKKVTKDYTVGTWKTTCLYFE